MSPNQSLFGEHPEGVVHGLTRNGSDLGANLLGNVIRSAMGPQRYRPQHGQALGRDLETVFAELFSGIVGHAPNCRADSGLCPELESCHFLGRDAWFFQANRATTRHRVGALRQRLEISQAITHSLFGHQQFGPTGGSSPASCASWPPSPAQTDAGAEIGLGLSWSWSTTKRATARHVWRPDGNNRSDPAFLPTLP